MAKLLVLYRRRRWHSRLPSNLAQGVQWEKERKRAVDFSGLLLFAGPSSDLKPSRNECQRRPKNTEAWHQHTFQPDAAYSQPQNAPPVFRSWVSNAAVLELAACIGQQRARAFPFHQSHR